MQERPVFGVLLRRHRQAAGLTQEELAERARLSTRAVLDLERGARLVPRRETVQLLAEALTLAPAERAVFEAAARRTPPPDPPLRPSVTRSPAAGRPDLPLVGRRRELLLLEQHRAGDGPPLLLFAGESGIGKSRLLREASRAAEQGGMTVLRGGCQRRGGQEPFAPLLQAIERHIHAQPSAQLREALRGCAWLVRLLPELAGGPIDPLPAWRVSPEQERHLMDGAVLRYLANITAPAGTLLVLDDLQWAGPDALNLLVLLVQEATTSLRVVGAYRDTEVGPHEPLGVTLADLAQQGLARQHQLTSLAEEEAGELLNTLLEDVAGDHAALVTQIAQRTGGVPFFVVSCAQALRRDAASPGEATIPWDVTQGIRQRVAALPGVAQEVLGVAALAGRVVEPPLIIAVVNEPEPTVLEALDVACQARLLLEIEAGFQFAHDLIREVVEAGVGHGRRLAVHRRIAEALERRAARSGTVPSAAVLAYHYGHSDDRDKALWYLEQAGDQAQVQAAYATAAECYRELVDQLDRLGRALDAARARERLAEALAHAARREEALAVLSDAADRYRTAGALESLGLVAAHIGDLYAQGNANDAGVELLQPLALVLEAGGPSVGLALIHLALSELFYRGGRYMEMLGAAERAATVARVLGEERLLAAAEAARGSVLQILGRLNEGLAAFQEAVRLMDACGDLAPSVVQAHHVEPGRRHVPPGPPHREQSDAQAPLTQAKPWLMRYEPAMVLSITAVALAFKGMLRESARVAEQSVSIAARRADPRYSAWTMAVRGHIRLILGDRGGARTDAEQSVALYRQFGLGSLFAYGLVLRGWLNMREGAWDTANHDLEECLAIFTPSGDLQALRLSHHVLAEIDIGSGRPAAARRRLLPLLDRPGLQEADVTSHVLPNLAWASLELGETVQASDLALHAVRRARMEGSLLSLADNLRIQALVAIRQGRGEDAVQALDEGLLLARSMPYPYAEARLLLVRGQVHAERGESQPARGRLEAALAIFERLGARKDLEQAEQLPAALG